MQFAKMFVVLLLAVFVGFAFGQPPAAPESATRLDRLHKERIEVYSEMLELAHARGSHGQEQQRKLLLVKLDAAKTRVDRIALAKELVGLCREHERQIRATIPDDHDTMLKARSQRIEAEILLEEILASE